MLHAGKIINAVYASPHPTFILIQLCFEVNTIFLDHHCTILNKMAFAYVIRQILNNRSNDNNVINIASYLTLTALFQISRL